MSICLSVVCSSQWLPISELKALPAMWDDTVLYRVYTSKHKLTWTTHEANLEHTSCTSTCILNTFASCLLRVCFLV